MKVSCTSLKENLIHKIGYEQIEEALWISIIQTSLRLGELRFGELSGNPIPKRF